MEVETKKCNRCSKELPVDAFNWRNRALGTRQRTCRECQKIQKNAWYARNSETHKSNMYEQKLRKISEAREYIWAYLSSHPCVICGERDPAVLEFDHVRGIKRTEVSKLVNGGYPLSTIQAEISKCQILCANCHRRKTNKEQGSWRS